MTMIERVARAMAGQLGPEYDELPRDKAHKRALSRHAHLAVDYTQDDLCDAAKTALEAMREPSMDMKLAGAAAITAQMPKKDVQADYDAAHDGWSAMINKALEGE